MFQKFFSARDTVEIAIAIEIAAERSKADFDFNRDQDGIAPLLPGGHLDGKCGYGYYIELKITNDDPVTFIKHRENSITGIAGSPAPGGDSAQGRHHAR